MKFLSIIIFHLFFLHIISHCPESFFYAAKTTESGPKKISKRVEDAGVHLCVYFDLFLKNIPIESAELPAIENINNLKNKIIPNKSNLLTMVHKLIRNVGILLESIPDLRTYIPGTDFPKVK